MSYTTRKRVCLYDRRYFSADCNPERRAGSGRAVGGPVDAGAADAAGVEVHDEGHARRDAGYAELAAAAAVGRISTGGVLNDEGRPVGSCCGALGRRVNVGSHKAAGNVLRDGVERATRLTACRAGYLQNAVGQSGLPGRLLVQRPERRIIEIEHRRRDRAVHLHLLRLSISGRIGDIAAVVVGAL